MNERCGYIDVVKALTIYLVVLGHVIQFWQYKDSWWNERLFLIIYSFHMPLFMMVSGLVVGMFRKHIPYSAFIRKRFIQLMIPYLSWALIYVLRKPKLEFEMIFTYPNNCLWFLWTLFFISIMVEPCLRLDNVHKKYLYYIVVILCMLSFKKLFGNIFAMDKINQYLIFYILGVELGLCKKRMLLIRKSIVLFPLWSLMACFYKWGGNMNNVILNHIYIFVMSFSGCLSFISLICKTQKSLEKSVILKVGMSTLGIYAIHYLVIDAFSMLDYFEHNIFLCLISSVIAVGLCLLIIEVILKSKILSFLLLGKIKIDV
jgi:fucose 4-O-acetylase-like acetyltransferase